MKTKLIITADDYGISKAIDDAAIEGIKKGVINTVTVLMNFERSKKALIRLIKVLVDENLLDTVGIGIHLNVTTGKPISKTGVKSLIEKDTGNFHNFDFIKITNKKFFKELELIKELSAQIQTFLLAVKESGHKVKLDHLTSQHNVFQSINHFAKILATMANTFKLVGKHPDKPIPVRRPIPIFKELGKNILVKKKIKKLSRETRFHIVNNNLSTESIFYLAKWMQKKKLQGIINNTFNGNGIKTPHGMFLCFYGSSKDQEDKIVDFNNIMADIRSAAEDQNILKPEEDFYIEIVHHLGKKPTENQIDQVRDISCFDIDYFKENRPNEFQLVMSNEYQDLLSQNNIERANYSDLNSQNNVIDIIA